MKNIGWLLSLLGLVLAGYALFMDVSVIAGDGVRVNNIGLMSERQNYIILAGFLFIAGILVSYLPRKKATPEVDVRKIDSYRYSDFVINNDGSEKLNINVIDEYSIVLLRKHENSSVKDIVLMNMPTIDKIEKSLPPTLGKEFRKTLERRLKENS